MQPGEVRQRAAELFALSAAGDLQVTIDRVFPLEALPEAHRVLESRQSRGKLLVQP
jgi:NADPH2:quinone reductase